MNLQQKAPFQFSHDAFLSLSDELAFQSSVDGDSSGEDGHTQEDSELVVLWNQLKELNQRMAEKIIASEATIYDIEQLNLNRAMSMIDISAVWLLFISTDRAIMEKKFVHDRITAIRALVKEFSAWLDDRVEA